MLSNERQKWAVALLAVLCLVVGPAASAAQQPSTPAMPPDVPKLGSTIVAAPRPWRHDLNPQDVACQSRFSCSVLPRQVALGAASAGSSAQHDHADDAGQ